MSTATLPVSRPSGKLASIGQAARLANVHPETIRRYMSSGLIEGVTTPGGHRRVSLSSVADAFGIPYGMEDDGKENESCGRVVVAYARVSTNKQKQEGNLDRQIERLKTFCAEKFPGQTVKVISEVGSGLSDQRQGFLRMVELLSAGKIAALVCEYRDRIARFGVGVVQRLCEAHGTEFVESRTGDEQEHVTTAEQEMAKDVLAIMAVYSNRAMGKRGGEKTKTVPPPGFREFVCQLAGSGVGRRDIVAAVEKRGFVCLNTGRKLGPRPVIRILHELRANGPVVPTSVKTFLRKRCTLGAGKRCRSEFLYSAYVDHCQQSKIQPLNQQKWTEYLQQSVRGLRFEYGRFAVMFGLTLKHHATA